MNVNSVLLLAVVTLVTCLAACSPALNWREVRIEQLAALLPCKPDHAERTVRLGMQDVVLQMSGCEASGSLYAVSHARAGQDGLVAEIQADWRRSTLSNMRATSVQTQVLKPTKALALDAGQGAGPQIVAAIGQAPDGRRVQARLLWLQHGVDIYHVAVYGSQLTDETSELLFSDLRLQ